MITRLRRRGATFLVALAVASAVTVALIHVWIRMQVIQVGYDLGRESKIHHDLAQQNQRLRLELETRKDPSVIERRAREELHMAPPDPGAIRVLRLAHVGNASPLAAAPGDPR
ncbi:MAG: hypothetical protein EXR72_20135 [Myxococcales bacterium]|nr:hypothetical protein [Myxococcales bacterium]